MTDSTGDFFNTLANILLRCWIIGFVLLFIWFLAVLLAGDLVNSLHGPMFGLSVHELELIFYCGMGILKMFVLVFFFYSLAIYQAGIKEGLRA